MLDLFLHEPLLVILRPRLARANRSCTSNLCFSDAHPAKKLYISRYIDISGRFIAGERFNSDLVRTGFYRKPLKRSFMNTLDEAYPGNSDRVLVTSLPGLFPLNLPSLLRQTALS